MVVFFMIELLFVVPATSGADDANGLPAHGENDCPEFSTDLPDGEIASLSGLIAFQLKDRAFPHSFCIREKEFMLFEVALVLGFIPLEFHLVYAHTKTLDSQMSLSIFIPL